MKPAKKRKPEDKETAAPPTKRPVKQKKHALKVKANKKDENPQGMRKAPVACDKQGCDHSGLLDLLPLDRKRLQACVKKGGWLCKAPCCDCANDEGGGDKRVLDVSDALKVKGKGELGVCCNCGPVGHNVVEEEEPVRKRQWTCTMVLCPRCVSKRKAAMGGTDSRRSRKPKQVCSL